MRPRDGSRRTHPRSRRAISSPTTELRKNRYPLSRLRWPGKSFKCFGILAKNHSESLRNPHKRKNVWAGQGPGGFYRTDRDSLAIARPDRSGCRRPPSPSPSRGVGDGPGAAGPDWKPAGSRRPRCRRTPGCPAEARRAFRPGPGPGGRRRRTERNGAGGRLRRGHFPPEETRRRIGPGRGPAQAEGIGRGEPSAARTPFCCNVPVLLLLSPCFLLGGSSQAVSVCPFEGMTTPAQSRGTVPTEKCLSF